MTFTLPPIFRQWLEKWCKITPDNGKYDRTLLLLFISLLLMGIVLVFSASVMDPVYYATAPSKRVNMEPSMFRILKSELMNVAVALVAFTVVLSIPMSFWQKRLNWILYAVTFLMLAYLFVGGGIAINGARRWIGIGFRFQPGELAKFTTICFLASYIARNYENVRNKKYSIVRPMFTVFILAFLALSQPDTGTFFVILFTAIGMLFLAGIQMTQMVIAIVSLGILIGISVLLNPYKLQRFTSFLDPFENPFRSGYQLSNSLMAFGRGEIWGNGLGNSVQKLAYLPERHTDFILAVMGEEFGLVGILFIVYLLGVLIFKALNIARQALQQEARFRGFFASGIAIWILCQGTINLGGALGLLPTKGLTFPLISYGGSSLMMMSMGIGILLRIDYENRRQKLEEATNATT